MLPQLRSTPITHSPKPPVCLRWEQPHHLGEMEIHSTVAKYTTFECHAVMVTASVKVSMVFVYRHSGKIGSFEDKVDILLLTIC